MAAREVKPASLLQLWRLTRFKLRASHSHRMKLRRCNRRRPRADTKAQSRVGLIPIPTPRRCLKIRSQRPHARILCNDIPSSGDAGGNMAHAAQYDSVSGSVPSDPFGLQNAGGGDSCGRGRLQPRCRRGRFDFGPKYGSCKRQCFQRNANQAAPPGKLPALPLRQARSNQSTMIVAQRPTQFAQNAPNTDRYGNGGFNDRGGGRYGSDAQESAAAAISSTMQRPSEVASQEWRLQDSYRSNGNARIAAKTRTRSQGGVASGTPRPVASSLARLRQCSRPTPVNVEGLGRPGEKKLEGPQNPSVTIKKYAHGRKFKSTSRRRLNSRRKHGTGAGGERRSDGRRSARHAVHQ